MTTDTTAKRKTKAQQAAEDKAAETARAEQNAKARHDLKFLIRSTTQGEWLAVCRGLDVARSTINEDEDLLLLAMAWVLEKRRHGAASWDVLLDMTDRDVLELHGFALKAHEDDPDGSAGS